MIRILATDYLIDLQIFFRTRLMFERRALDQAPDNQIWEYARDNDFCIVTQDSDFAERSRLYGVPPKVVWLRCGNMTPQQVEAILRHHAVLITELIQNPTLHYAMII